MGLIGPTGTPEASWQAWPGLGRLDPWSPPATPRRAVVVAPHPDDETLAAAGLMCALAAAGWELEVVLVTAGEASHPEASTVGADALAECRLQESRAALEVLGLGSTPLTCLALPDGRVEAHEERLVVDLAEHLLGADLVCTTTPDDGHRDHEATARAVARATSDGAATVLGLPIWTWHWARPGDERVAWWQRARRLLLTDGQRAAKRRAIACHRTQVAPLGPGAGDAPVLDQEMVDHFLRSFEVVVTA